MARVAYTVTATLPDDGMRGEYEVWLREHVKGVIAGGAMRAEIVRLSDPALQVQARYEFPSDEVFQRYLREYAPRLRAEGLARFGPHAGVAFRREVGSILE